MTKEVKELRAAGYSDEQIINMLSEGDDELKKQLEDEVKGNAESVDEVKTEVKSF